VLNVNPRAPASNHYISISGGVDLLKELFRHAYGDWTLSVHTNGRNRKSWMIALLGGIAAQFGPGATLTLHSGDVPKYLRDGTAFSRAIARMSCLLYNQVVCVNQEIADTLASLGIPKHQLDITPAFLPIEPPRVTVPAELDGWMKAHSPLISSTMFFRPEYGFDLLVHAVSALRGRYPNLGCLVMGNKDGCRDAEAFVEQKGLRGSVLLAGDLDHELCLAVMSRCSVFVRPTLLDGDSISVREAVALGVPVVASNVGTRPDGVVLFEAGTLGGLITQLETTLESVCTPLL